MMIFMWVQWVLWVQEAGGRRAWGGRSAPKAPKFFPLYFYYRIFFKIKVSGGVEKSRGGSRGEQGGSTHMAVGGGWKKSSLPPSAQTTGSIASGISVGRDHAVTIVRNDCKPE